MLVVQLNLAESWLQPTDTTRLVGSQGTMQRKVDDEAANEQTEQSQGLQARTYYLSSACNLATTTLD